MANKIAKERFIGGYNRSVSPFLLPPGVIVEGSNVRLAGITGGWKCRGGSLLRNTTAASDPVTELFPFQNSNMTEATLIGHVGGWLWNLGATADALTQASGLGSAMFNAGSSLGFATSMADGFIYANGDGTPIIYYGTSYKPAFFLKRFESGGVLVDYDGTDIVTDKDTSTLITSGGSTDFSLYVCGKERLDSIIFTLGSTTNDLAATLSVKAWRSGAWTAVSSLSDGTSSGGKTLKQSGTVSWTASSLDEMKVINGVMGYWYHVEWSTTINTTDITGCMVHSDMSRMTNKWDGIVDYAATALAYSGGFTDATGTLATDTEATYVDIGGYASSDYIYLKSNVPLSGIGLALVAGNENSNAATLVIEVWDSAGSWTTVSDLDDGTSDGTNTLAKTGYAFWDFNAVDPIKRTITGLDNVAGYWYRISFSAALSASTYLYLTVTAAAPLPLYKFTGCTSYEGMLILWGDPFYPNRLRTSPVNQPDELGSESDSYTSPFGDGEAIVVAKTFGNYLLVGKNKGMFLMNSDLNRTQVSARVGIIAPHTLQTIEIGNTTMQKDTTINIAIWLDSDGVYQYDLQGVKKISSPIDVYFNPSDAQYLGAANIAAATSMIDSTRNEYHLFIGSTELVYNYEAEIWYPPWSRAITLTNAIEFKWDDKRYYTYGVSANGFVVQLECASTDRNASNAETAITHNIKTRVITPFDDGVAFSFNVRRLWIVHKMGNHTSAVFTTYIYKDTVLSGTSLGTASLYKSGYGYVISRIDIAEDDYSCMEILLAGSSLYAGLEVYEIIYEYEERAILAE